MPPEQPAGRACADAFAVVATEAEVEAFRSATASAPDGPGPAGDVLPATFPMRWLAAPEVRRLLLAAVPEPGLVPVHEGQSFDYARPLRVGEPYRLKLATRREAEPPRLVVDGRIEDADGTLRATLETILRLVPIGGVA